MLIAGLCLASYLLGAIPFGVLIARSRGVDIFSFGSNNPGATNVGRAFGRTIGALVFVLDVLKGLIPAVAGLWITGDQTIALVFGISAVLGHSLSPFLRFRGGKGISTGLGALMGTSPLLGLITLAVFLVCFVAIRIVSLSSMTAACALIVLALVIDLPVPVRVVYVLLALFVVVRHQPNIIRLLNGTEPKFEFGSQRTPNADPGFDRKADE